MKKSARFLVCALVIGLAACAEPPPAPAAPPAPAPAAVAKPEPVPSASAVAEPVPAEPAPAAEPPPEPAAQEKPSRPALEILTLPDTAFLINYPSSAPSEAARKTCSEKGGTDDEAIAKCMSEARAAFKADVVRFKKDGSRFSCVVYKRDGSRLDEVYSARVELSDESPNSVKLKFTSAEKGQRPLLSGKREAVLDVPNDYSFVVTDPNLGRLVYEAKVGLVGR